MQSKFIILLFCVSILGYSQKYQTRTGFVEFNASTQGFEPIKAKSNSSSAILDTSSGKFAALTLVKGFRFKIALMEEHFNESYAESDKYPKSTFKGQIEDFNLSKLSSTPKEFKLKGKFSFHGIEKNIETKVLVSLVNNKIKVKGKFVAIPSEFGVKIGSTVAKKVAKKVDVNFSFDLGKK